MRRTITALYLIKFSKWFMLTMPVVALFYAENGLSSSDLFLLQAAYSLTIALMEIPLGYLADLMGRRQTLIGGTLLGTAGFAVYASSYGFAGFLCAEILLGIGQSLISGADSALLFDTLCENGRGHEFLKHEGRITSIGNYAETLAAAVGGLVASLLALRSVYMAQVLIMAVGIPAAIMLREPNVARPPRRSITQSMRNIVSITQYSLYRNPHLGSAIILSSVIGMATLAMAWVAQTYFVCHHFSAFTVTALWVALNFTVATSSLFPQNMTDRFGTKRIMLFITAGIPIGYLAMAALPPVAAVSSLFLFYVIRGLATPILKNYVNTYCLPEYRATVLSVRSLVIRLGFAAFGPMIGYLSDSCGMSAALACGFAVLSVLALSSAVWFFRVRKPGMSIIAYLRT